MDVLERRAQLSENFDVGYRTRQKYSIKARMLLNEEYREKQRQFGDELARLYADGTDRDRLILDIYTTLTKSKSSDSVQWNHSLRPEKTRQLIARVTRMSEDEIREELRKAQEALERKTAAIHKAGETRWLNSRRTPEQREKKRREARRKYLRGYRKRRKEERRLQAEQHQPTQVFPPPAKE